MFLFLTTVACALMVLISAHPTGAPIEACGNFESKHHPDNDETRPRFQPQTSPPPYKITPSPATVAPGGNVEVTIQGINEYFKGFLIQAIDKNSRKIVGAFKKAGGHAQTLDCPGGQPGNTITHTEASEKTSVKLSWTAPAGYAGDVIFRATIVKTHDTFWYNVRSSPLTVG